MCPNAHVKGQFGGIHFLGPKDQTQLNQIWKTAPVSTEQSHPTQGKILYPMKIYFKGLWNKDILNNKQNLWKFDAKNPKLEKKKH